MSSLLSRTSQKPWEEVLSVSTGASVFLDDGAAEALHWCEAEEELLRASLGVYSLGANLNPVAKDFIAQVCSILQVDNKCMLSYEERTIIYQLTTPLIN